MKSEEHKPYSKMNDQEKKDYKRFIQKKYIKDFNEYLKIITKGRITIRDKRMVIEWVDALSKFGPGVLQAGWTGWIQKLRPNYLPSIADAITHFKGVSYNITRNKHENIKHEEVSVESGSDFSKLMQICMKYSTIKPISFHKQCIKYYDEMAGKENDRSNKIAFKEASHEHKKLLKEAESNPNSQKIAKGHQKKIAGKINNIFVDPPKKKMMRGDQSPI